MRPGSWHGISLRNPQGNVEAQGLATEEPLEPYERIGSAWSAIEPADPRYRVDPVLVREIRRLDPDFVPLWLTTEHQSPSGAIVRCVHHAIAWRIRTPHKRHQERQILWPTSPGAINYGYGGYAIFVEEILQGQETQAGPEFKPLSWEDYKRIKYGIWWQKHEMPSTPEEEAFRAISAAEDAKERAEQKMLDELSYRFDNAAKGVGRHLDQIGSADIQAWGAPREDKKPFVEVRNP